MGQFPMQEMAIFGSNFGAIQQSIGALSSGEMEWLKDIQIVAEKCEAMHLQEPVRNPAEGAEPGDFAIHRSVKNLGLRIVISGGGGGNVSLVKLCKTDERMTFTPDKLAVVRPF